MKRGRSRFTSLLFLAFYFSISTSFADSSSATFRLESETATGGGAISVTSTNFRTEESSLEWFSKESLASANYKMEARVGVSGTNPIPVINSIMPGDFARFYTDQSSSFTVQAKSPDSTALQYRVKQDGTVKVGPQASSTLTWPLSVSDKGRHNVTFEVIHPKGNVAKTQAEYVYRRPVK
ncbi:MAG: hypothetical protein HY447_02350 [Candidatus Omnitrophica bacterium]|nr:hypothetical protein [Candidatus Omnitrophota bacterium]